MSGFLLHRQRIAGQTPFSSGARPVPPSLRNHSLLRSVRPQIADYGRIGPKNAVMPPRLRLRVHAFVFGSSAGPALCGLNPASFRQIPRGVIAHRTGPNSVLVIPMVAFGRRQTNPEIDQPITNAVLLPAPSAIPPHTPVPGNAPVLLRTTMPCWREMYPFI